MIIEDISPGKFAKCIIDKKVFLFGAGRTAGHCMDIYCRECQIEGIVDNNKKLWGSYFEYFGKRIPIISVDSFVRRLKQMNIEQVVLLITTVFYAGKVIEQLEKISETRKLHSYLHFLLRNHAETAQTFEFTKGQARIPKIIHSFWFGGKELPEILKHYQRTWQEQCAEYEILQWDETNYDVYKNPYIKEAYENGKWGFVSDYARLDILYQYGGIYLDTDVEILRPFDLLLNDDAFFGMGGNDQVNTGSGFGAVPGHKLIRDLRDYYEKKSFYKSDGGLNLMPCYHYQHPVLREYGFEIKNTYQKIKGVVIYPAEVLSPTGTGGMGNFYTHNTFSVHHTELSWILAEEREALKETEKKLKEYRII